VEDDADTLFASQDCRPLLKSLCESTSPRPVSWKSKAVENEGLPASFDTSSPVAVLANRWKAHDPDMQAVSDRGQLVSFEPSVEQVHERVARLNYLGDREVHDFIGRHLEYVTTAPSHGISAGLLPRAYRFEMYRLSLRFARVVLRVMNPSCSSTPTIRLEAVSQLACAKVAPRQLVPISSVGSTRCSRI
jgi:hypothetical protein